jgi:hypothetical protein
MSHGSRPNDELRELPGKAETTNRAWLETNGKRNGLLLLGGTSLAHFRIRVAQSHLRKDMFPSFWSLAGFLVDGHKLMTVPLDGIGDAFTVTQNNGLCVCEVADYDSPVRFPNIAVLDFPVTTPSFTSNLDVVRNDRSVVDVPALILKWLGYVWGTEASGNPLLVGASLPCAAFVNAVAALARVNLTPGLSSNAGCPEAIWQAAKWWRSFYDGAQGSTADGAASWVPKGASWIRQPAAAITEP